MKQLKVNQKCSGCGLCVAQIGYLKEDEDGYACPIPGKPIKEEDMYIVEKVIAQCPESALYIEENRRTNKDGKDGIKEIIEDLKRKCESFSVKKIKRADITFNPKEYSIDIPYSSNEGRYNYSSESAAKSAARDEFNRLCYSQSAYRPMLKKLFVEYKIRVLSPYYLCKDTEESVYYEYNQQIRAYLADAYAEITDLIGEDNVPESWKDFSCYLSDSEWSIEALKTFDDESTKSGIIDAMNDVSHTSLSDYVSDMDTDYEEEYAGKGMFGDSKYKKVWCFNDFDRAAKSFIDDLKWAAGYMSSEITDQAERFVDATLKAFQEKIKETFEEKIRELEKYVDNVCIVDKDEADSIIEEEDIEGDYGDKDYEDYNQYAEKLEAYMKMEFDKLVELANSGNSNAQFAMGIRYDEGYGVENDIELAMMWYEKAANQGHALAQERFAEGFEIGEGVEQDLKKSIYWYEKSAEQGFFLAQYNLGKAYYIGGMIQQDYIEAVKWLQKAAVQEFAQAQLLLGTMWIEGKGVEQDFETGVTWLQKAADQNYAPAQSALGLLLFDGTLIQQDKNKGIQLVKKAADQGYEDAIHMLPNLMNDNVGYEACSELIQRGAQMGAAESQFNLGCMYLIGDGVPKDENKAFEWTKKAAVQNHANAQYNLASFYLQGTGTEINYFEAIKWYEKAAAQGIALAQYNLAHFYYNGQLVSQDVIKAVSLFRKAAETGLKEAQYMLGIAYYRGDGGLPQSVDKAVFWLNKAANQGLQEAKDDLIKLGKM